MKLFTLILSIYVMLLSGIACADGIEETSSGNTTTIVKAVTNPVHSDCCGDICSPFCACACCVGFTKPATQQISFFTFEVLQAYYDYQPQEYFSEPTPLFQPPRA